MRRRSKLLLLLRLGLRLVETLVDGCVVGRGRGELRLRLLLLLLELLLLHVRVR